MSKVINFLTAILMIFGIVLVGQGLHWGNSPKMIEKIEQLPAFDLQDSDSGHDDNLVPAMVRLEDENGEFFCSGTVVSNAYVLTAAHCLADSAGHLSKKKIHVVSMVNSGGLSVTVDAKAASRNTRADYGLVTGDFQAFNKLKMLTDPQQSIMVVGSSGPVVTCGFPWGSKDVCYPTGTKAITYYEGIKLAGVLYPGMSGGPVIDQGRGLVVAINSAVGDGYIVIMPLIGLFETLGVEVNE